MPVELLLPGRRVSAPKPPERVALNMAFGVGDPAILGDKSGYNSHGTITGAVPAAGVHGYCLDFDPTIPSYVHILANHNQLNFTSEDFSIIARVYVDSLAVHRYVVCRTGAALDGWSFSIRSDGSFRVETFQAMASQRSNSVGGSLIIGTWYTIGASRSGANAQVYRNGVDVTFFAGVHIDPDPSVATPKIGIFDNLVTYPFDGKMEFLRIFRNIALPVSSHLAWHNALA